MQKTRCIAFFIFRVLKEVQQIELNLWNWQKTLEVEFKRVEWL